MTDRLKLHKALCDALGPNVHVYFQPPESIKMKYPAFRYNYAGANRLFADGKTFVSHDIYEGTLIESGSESLYNNKILELPYVRLGRVYTSNNLTHYSYTIQI